MQEIPISTNESYVRKSPMKRREMSISLTVWMVWFLGQASSMQALCYAGFSCHLKPPSWKAAGPGTEACRKVSRRAFLQSHMWDMRVQGL